MNKPFKHAIIKKFATGYLAGRAMNLQPAVISNLVRGHRAPTPGERKKLRAFFSAYEMRKFFPRDVEAEQ